MITGLFHMDFTDVCFGLRTLAELGADVRWVPAAIFFQTQDHAAAAIASVGYSLFFAQKWEKNSEEYWWCTSSALSFPGGEGPNLFVDDGGWMLPNGSYRL
jgi:adenosylhomocysteinase